LSKGGDWEAKATHKGKNICEKSLTNHHLRKVFRKVGNQNGARLAKNYQTLVFLAVDSAARLWAKLFDKSNADTPIFLYEAPRPHQPTFVG
jgi:hypothetical protein